MSEPFGVIAVAPFAVKANTLSPARAALSFWLTNMPRLSTYLMKLNLSLSGLAVDILLSYL